MNGRDDWGRGRSGRRDVGADPLIDRALRMTRELYEVLQRAERQVDEASRDMRQAERLERRGEGYERRAEAMEREAYRDLQSGGRRDGDRDRGRGRSGRRDDWRGR